MSVNSYRLLFEALRGEPLAAVSQEDAAHAARLALGDGLLPVVLDALLPALAPGDAEFFASKVEESRRAAASNLDALAAFAREAAALQLSFAVIKGAVLSNFVFGDPLVRMSNDVDVLVAPADLPKADCAARRCGFVQPSESYRARQLMEAGLFDARMLRGIEAPFLSRTSEMAPHVIPYHRVNDEGVVCTLEIHDSFHLLDGREAERLLWRCAPVHLGDVNLMVCCPDDAFLLLALSAHDDIETVRANLGTATLALRTLHEMSLLLANPEAYGIELGRVAERVSELGLSRQLAPVFSGLCEAFPAVEGTVAAYFELGPSSWGMGYVERLEDRERMVANAGGVIGRALAACDGLPTRIRSSLELRDLGIGARVEEGDGEVHLAWKVPRRILGWLEGMVLHATLLMPNVGEGCLGLRVRTFARDGAWRSFVEWVTLGSFDEHPNRAPLGRELATQSRVEDGAIVVHVRIEGVASACKALFSVYAKRQCTHYRLVAGCSLVALAGRAVAGGGAQGEGRPRPSARGSAVGRAGMERGRA